MKKPLILIVDDQPTNLQVLGNALNDLDCDITFATGGNQALAMVPEITPNLILLDIVMPDLDGIAVCQSLKCNQRTKDIPIIFLTAKTDKDDVVRGLRAGAVDYVSKPFNSDELLARVTTHLELKRIRDEQAELIQKLNQALKDIKQLSGLLPICTYCKKIRKDDGYWQKVEKYIAHHSQAQFSHCICPQCLEQHFPEDSI